MSKTTVYGFKYAYLYDVIYTYIIIIMYECVRKYKNWSNNNNNNNYNAIVITVLPGIRHHLVDYVVHLPFGVSTYPGHVDVWFPVGSCSHLSASPPSCRCFEKVSFHAGLSIEEVSPMLFFFLILLFPYFYSLLLTPEVHGHTLSSVSQHIAPKRHFKGCGLNRTFYCSLSKPTMNFENTQSTHIDCTFC